MILMIVGALLFIGPTVRFFAWAGGAWVGSNPHEIVARWFASQSLHDMQRNSLELQAGIVLICAGVVAAASGL